jgi:hypothetical protein
VLYPELEEDAAIGKLEEPGLTQPLDFEDIFGGALDAGPTVVFSSFLFIGPGVFSSWPRLRSIGCSECGAARALNASRSPPPFEEKGRGSWEGINWRIIAALKALTFKQQVR